MEMEFNVFACTRQRCTHKMATKRRAYIQTYVGGGSSSRMSTAAVLGPCVHSTPQGSVLTAAATWQAFMNQVDGRQCKNKTKTVLCCTTQECSTVQETILPAWTGVQAAAAKTGTLRVYLRRPGIASTPSARRLGTRTSIIRVQFMYVRVQSIVVALSSMESRMSCVGVVPNVSPTPLFGRCRNPSQPVSVALNNGQQLQPRLCTFRYTEAVQTQTSEAVSSYRRYGHKTYRYW